MSHICTQFTVLLPLFRSDLPPTFWTTQEPFCYLFTKIRLQGPQRYFSTVHLSLCLVYSCVSRLLAVVAFRLLMCPYSLNNTTISGCMCFLSLNFLSCSIKIMRIHLVLTVLYINKYLISLRYLLFTFKIGCILYVGV